MNYVNYLLCMFQVIFFLENLVDDSECIRFIKILYIKYNILVECFILFLKRFVLVLVVLDESSKYFVYEVYNRIYILVLDFLRIIDIKEKYQ